MNARHALALILIAVASLCLLLGATLLLLWCIGQDTPLELLVYVCLPLFLAGGGLMAAGISQYRKSDHRLEAVADPGSEVRRPFPALSPIILITYLLLTLAGVVAFAEFGDKMLDAELIGGWLVLTAVILGALGRTLLRP